MQNKMHERLSPESVGQERAVSMVLVRSLASRLRDLFDKVFILCHTGVDTWVACSSTAVSKTHNSHLHESMFALTHQRAPRISLAGVLPTLWQSSANHAVREV